MRPVGQQKAVVFSGVFDGLDVIVSVRGPAERLSEVEAFAHQLAAVAESHGELLESVRPFCPREATGP